MELLAGRLTLRQHRDLLVTAGWLSLLLGCLHYDLAQRERAEAARQAAYQMDKQAGHNEIMGWAYEMSAWFALTEHRYEEPAMAAQAGQDVAGVSSAGVQLTLQEARGDARAGDRRAADQALKRGGTILSKVPIPAHPEHHFVFDHSKWIFYAATCYTFLGDDDRAEEHALEVITQHQRPDGTSKAPMRTTDAKIDLGMVYARRGELDAAADYGDAAFDFDRKSLADLVDRAGNLDQLLQVRYPGERLAQRFHERYLDAQQALGTGTHASG